MVSVGTKTQITSTSEKESILYNLTRSICPKCKRTIDAQILIKENKVFMKKRCPHHGWFESLISSDFEYYKNVEKFNKPGLTKLEYQTNVEKGCPDDCGICSEHKQHTCLALIEINSKCNMKCKVCFADPSEAGVNLPFEVVNEMIQTLMKSEEEIELIQLSGGEPTVHPDFFQIIRTCKESGVKTVMVNTNGRKFAASTDFATKTKEAGANAIYLQFDGFKNRTYERIRGNPNLLQEKLQAIQNLAEAGLSITLVMTIVEGINDDEIGEVIKFMHKTKGVTGLSLQPYFEEGRLIQEYDPLNHLTLPDILSKIETQTQRLYQKNDFFPIPCPDPHCSACTFSYIDPETKEFTTIRRLVDIEDYLDFFTNSTLPSNAEMAIRDALESLFSMATTPGSKELVEGYCAACGIDFNLNSIRSAFDDYLEHLKMITIKPFQSAWDLDVKRLMKCCIHEVLPDGKIMPFCAYNAIYRDNYNLRDYINPKDEAKDHYA
jgi:uncharacterized radical SAM superfamily Fe-S cluster-containing enzyme